MRMHGLHLLFENVKRGSWQYITGAVGLLEICILVRQTPNCSWNGEVHHAINITEVNAWLTVM